MKDGRSAEVQDPTYSVRAEISREMVRLYKEQFGSGTTRARTEFAGPDTVISMLEASLTPAERRLSEMGRGRGRRGETGKEVWGRVSARDMEVLEFVARFGWCRGMQWRDGREPRRR
jgi:Na+-translocating membrane potential-generating system (MpsC)